MVCKVIAFILTVFLCVRLNSLKIPLIQISETPDGLHRVPTENYEDRLYVGNVSIGIPQQYFRVLFSTRSADFWIPSQSCVDVGCQSKHKYVRQKSSTYVPDGRPIDITLGPEGSMKGFLDIDTVQVGGISLNNVTFGEAISLADFFVNQPMDGILGLAYPQIALDNVLPVFDVMLHDQKVISPVFSIFYDSGIGDTKSFIDFGNIDSGYYDGELAYVPVSQPGYWQLELDGVLINGSDVGNCQGWFSTCSAVIDSGSPTIQVPLRAFEIIVNLLGPIPTNCAEINDLPYLTFQFGDLSLILESAWYILKVNGICSLAITSGNLPFWVLGVPFMRRYFTVFDRGMDRVGFATTKS